MLIEIPNYNLDEVCKIVARALVKNKPTLTRQEYADELGVTQRTIYRMINDGIVTIPRGGIGIATAIAKLEKAGYKVLKGEVTN